MTRQENCLFETIICRKALDEKYMNPWICECPKCVLERKTISLSNGNGAGPHDTESPPGT